MSLQTNHVASDNAAPLTRIDYLVRSLLSKVRTTMPVEVVAVSNADGVSQIGTVTVRPLVSAVDGNGNLWPHGTISNVPYMRIQGGANAIIIDPQVGDIGVASVCDRDISAAKRTGQTSAPGSNRRHDMSDIIYLQSIISVIPAQYIQFNTSGISIVSPTKVEIQAPTVQADCTTLTVNSTNATVNTTGAAKIVSGDAQINSTSAEINVSTAQVNATTSATVVSPAINFGNGGSLQALVNAAFETLFNSHVHYVSSTGVPTGAPTTPMTSAQLTSVVKAQ